MTDYVVESPQEVSFPYRVQFEPFRLRRKGAGYLAGEFPDGITTVGGAPVSATVRVLLRTEPGHPGDGVPVAEVQSAPDGTWRVEGLPLGWRFDVVGRKEGHNDIIVANVAPKQM